MVLPNEGYESRSGIPYYDMVTEVNGDVDGSGVKIRRHRPRLDEQGHAIDQWGAPLREQPESAIGALPAGLGESTGLAGPKVYPTGNEEADQRRRALLQEWQVQSLLDNAGRASEAFKDAIATVVFHVNRIAGGNVCQHTENFNYLIKSFESAKDKAARIDERWDQGVLLSLMDVLRTTLICDNAMIMGEAIDELNIFALQMPGMEILPVGQNWFEKAVAEFKKEKAKGADADYSGIGYADIKQMLLIPFELPTGDTGQIAAEVQVQHKDLLDIKEDGGGHAFYDLNRAFNRDTGEISASAAGVKQATQTLMAENMWKKAVVPNLKPPIEDLNAFRWKFFALFSGRDQVFSPAERDALWHAGKAIYGDFWKNYSD